jgi:serine/threonine protein kinase
VHFRLQVAIKFISKDALKTKKQHIRINREINALKLLDHPNVIKVRTGCPVYGRGARKYGWVVGHVVLLKGRILGGVKAGTRETCPTYLLKQEFATEAMAHGAGVRDF